MSSQTVFDKEYFKARILEVIGDESNAEFAKRVGITVGSLYNYRDGRIADTATLWIISQGTGKPMEWFLKPKDPLLNRQAFVRHDDMEMPLPVSLRLLDR